MLVRPEQIRPYGRRLLVVKYERPERVRSIWLSPAWRIDNSRSLWEPVAYGEEALRWFEENLPIEEWLEALRRKECILVTRPHSGVYVELDDPREHYFLLAEQVLQVVPYETVTQEGRD
jgi:hypothetical protein